MVGRPVPPGKPRRPKAALGAFRLHLTGACKIAGFPQRTMAKAPQPTPVPAPGFIRLLARLVDAGIRPSGHTLAERLGEWIDWTRALALSKALDGRLPAAATDAPGGGDGAIAECAQVRAALVAAISASDGAAPASHPLAAASAADDYAVHRERYLDLQRSMQVATGRLRGQLRDRLGAASPGLARLAEVDAVMELTLSPREHALLATVPGLLGHHFHRLREAAATVPAAAQAVIGDTAPPPRTWLDGFRQDMRQVLLAELEVRFHPVEGLLAALHAR